MSSKHQLVQILDFGSQYTQLIARRIRELGVYCEIRPCTDRAPESFAPNTIALILSGGPASVVSEDAPNFDPNWLKIGTPILGICYGMQLLTHLAGGTVERGMTREYGQSEIHPTGSCILLKDFNPKGHSVWMSHGDHIEQCPPGYAVNARSNNGVVAVMSNDADKIYGLQFHPEVTHTTDGTLLIKRFIFDIAGATGDWTSDSFIEESLATIRATVKDSTVICGLSGGVDSSVVTAMLHQAVPNQLVAVFVDNGLCRKNEVQEVKEEFSEYNLIVADASERFLTGLAGVTDPEKKRKIIGETFIRVFEEYAREYPDAKFLAQGTLYPDVIESISVRGPSAAIKSHHNVGGLPDDMQFELIEPLRELFKDEVRRVGERLGLSKARVWRHPFPGPGLAVRCLGNITKERLHTLAEADAIVREELVTSGWYDKVWQAFVVLLPVQSVGVMGDERTYEEAAVIRVVDSTDGMTANWSQLPYDLIGKMSSRIINEVPGINRVAYDVSSKPPATIEWE